MQAIRGAPANRPFEGKHAELTEKVLGVFYRVYNDLGYGFSESVYEKAFAIALQEAGLEVEEQVEIKVFFHGRQVGVFRADLIVNGLILLELKSVGSILEEHESQLLNYLKATELEIGYLINFGKKAEFKRKVFDNNRKGSLNWMRK